MLLHIIYPSYILCLLVVSARYNTHPCIFVRWRKRKGEERTERMPLGVISGGICMRRMNRSVCFCVIVELSLRLVCVSLSALRTWVWCMLFELIALRLQTHWNVNGKQTCLFVWFWRYGDTHANTRVLMKEMRETSPFVGVRFTSDTTAVTLARPTRTLDVSLVLPSFRHRCNTIERYISAASFGHEFFCTCSHHVEKIPLICRARVWAQ